MSIQVQNIHKAFGDFVALGDVSLDFPTGELVALLGPSGCGKTTLLRIIAGLESADSGRVLLDGEDASDTHVRERHVGFVFQHYALFRHMSVFDNVAFGLRMKPRSQRPSEKVIRTKVHDLLKLVQLDWLADRFPAQLSGGQRQRIALARALAVEPRVLLLDEPFGALDARVRKDLRRWLRELHDRTGYTTIFVTHDQEEALELADRVVVMNRGRIEQVGTTDEVYEKPASPFVFDFLGDVNVLEAEVRGRNVYLPGSDMPIVTDSIQPAGPVDLYVRPGDLRLAEAGAPGIDVEVLSTQRTGPIVRAQAETLVGRIPLTVELPHLHHDVPRFCQKGQVRLRLMQFSLYPREARPAGSPLEAPALSSAEQRERGRLG
jgi:sulfate/thiosulfate transport system ATP-binding protein